MKYLLIALLAVSALAGNAQCKVENSFFKAGEELQYDLYFKYGLLNTKAGKSSMTVDAGRYNGRDALKMQLIGNTGGVAKKLFSLSDTLTSYMTPDLVPLAFLKDAHESGEHTIERATYTYNGGKVNVHTNRIRDNVERFDENLTSETCLYDMLSVVYYARTLDYHTMKKGDKVSISFLSGKNLQSMDIVHQGIESVGANDGRKYNCVKLVLIINTEAFEDNKEAMKVYITNDPNRVPIRIDSKLKVGSTRAVLKSMTGMAH